MKCQHCGITLPNLGDIDYKKAAEMEAEIDRLKADKEKLVGALKTIISKARGDSVAAHVAVAVIKEVQHD